MLPKMLWWKEFRENRLIALLGILASVVLSSIMAMPRSRMFNYSEDLIFLNYIVLYPLFALLIGVNMISPELASDTLPFLLANPIKRWKVWIVKFFAGIFYLGLLILLSTLYTFLITKFVLHQQWSLDIPVLEWTVGWVYLIGILYFYVIGFFTSALFEEPMKATVAGILVGSGILAGIAFLAEIPTNLGWSKMSIFLLLLGSWATILLVSSLLIFLHGGLLEGRGAVLKKMGRVYGKIAGAILLIGLIIHTGFNYTAGKALKRELQKIKDSGAPLTSTEVAPPPIPDEENAALLYQKAFDLLQEGNEEEKKAFNSITVYRKKVIDWSKENILAIGSLLEKNEEALNLVQQATRLEKYRFPVEYEEGPAMLLPHLNKMRELARLLAAKALLQNEEGKAEEALKTCQAGFQMGKSLLPEPILVSQLVRISINATLLQTMEIILNQNEAQPAIYEALIKELDDLEGRTAFTRSIEEGEHILGLWWFRQIRKKPSMVSRSFGQPWVRLYGSYLFRPILKRDQVYYLQIMKRTIALSRLPYHQAIAVIRDFEKEFGEELENVPRYYFLTRMLIPFLNKDYSVFQARSEAQIRSAKLALALKIYKAKKGIYPETLKALTPEILPQLPEDPFTGKDYIYRREGEGFLVYSVGQNLKDDQGTFDPKPWEERDDIIWRCEK